MKFDVPAKVINKLFDNGYEEQIIDIITRVLQLLFSKCSFKIDNI